MILIQLSAGGHYGMRGRMEERKEKKNGDGEEIGRRGERGRWNSANWRGEGGLFTEERKDGHSLSCLSVSQHSGTECSGFADCTQVRQSCVKYT